MPQSPPRLPRTALLANALVGVLVIGAALWFRLGASGKDTATPSEVGGTEDVGPDGTGTRVGEAARSEDQALGPAHEAGGAPANVEDEGVAIDPVLRERLAPLVDAARRVAERHGDRRGVAPANADPPLAKRPPFKPDRDGIKAAMAAAKEELKACYEPWLAMNPELAGDIAVSFTIGAREGGDARADDSPATADVGAVSIAEGGLGNEVLEGCVVDVVGDLEFAPPSAELKVTFPLRFDQTPDREPGAEGR